MKKIFVTISMLGAASGAFACNTCGCAATNQSVGILPELAGHFIGLQYQYRWYESQHDKSEAPQPAGHEYYQTVQLWGRYALGKRVQLFGFLPYQYNSKTESGARNVLSGIGDATVLANYQILRPKTTCDTWAQYLQAGGGVKMPTGKYNNAILGGGDELAPNMQAGSGSWDFLANANYTLQHGKGGLNVEAAYALTLPNHQDYKYGNRLSGSMQAFYSLEKKKLRILPAAGFRYEQAAQDYDNYTVRSLADYTGGYMLYATVGAQAYYNKHWAITATGYLPAAQYYGDGLVKSRGKVDGGVIYLF